MKEIEKIFDRSKKSKIKKSNNLCEIVVDTREKQSLVIPNLIEKNANIKFEKLEIGDYIVGEIAIERKTFSDFISSTLNKRIQQQLLNLKKYPKYLLIIEGRSDYINEIQQAECQEKKIKIHPNAIRGMFLSIIFDFNVPIIFTQDEEETATFLILLAKKQEKTKTNISLRPNKSNLTLEEQKQFILEGFPGIGPVTAKQLLEKFNSLERIFTATKEELKTIKTLTDAKIEKFQQILKN